MGLVARQGGEQIADGRLGRDRVGCADVVNGLTPLTYRRTALDRLYDHYATAGCVAMTAARWTAVDLAPSCTLLHSTGPALTALIPVSWAADLVEVASRAAAGIANTRCARQMWTNT